MPSPTYFAEFGTPQSFQDLAQHNCLLHTQCLVQTSGARDKGRELRVQVSEFVPTVHTRYVTQPCGCRCGDVADYTAGEEGRLQAIFVDACPANINVYALFPYTKHVSPKLRVFLDYVVNAFK